MYDSLYTQEVQEVCVWVNTLAYGPYIRSIQYNLC